MGAEARGGCGQWGLRPGEAEARGGWVACPPEPTLSCSVEPELAGGGGPLVLSEIKLIIRRKHSHSLLFTPTGPPPSPLHQDVALPPRGLRVV